MEPLLKYLWLIPAFPLAAAALSALARQRHRKFSAFLAIISMVMATGLSFIALSNSIQYAAHHGAAPGEAGEVLDVEEVGSRTNLDAGRGEPGHEAIMR